MNRCIYSGADETTATFQSAEHIFPKCIGGQRCLPRGVVSDEVNQKFSRMELGFARHYPLVVFRRMFAPQMGRKKHGNRDRIGIFQDIDQGLGYCLGMIQNCVPHPINQLVIEKELQDEAQSKFPIKVIMEPSAQMTLDEQFYAFWKALRGYNGNPTCIKSKNLQPHTYLLGHSGKCWYLGISKEGNPEEVKPKLKKQIEEIASHGIEELWRKNPQVTKQQHHVEVEFGFSFNYIDCLRVYAKIAINALAEVKGHEFALDPALDGVKHMVLTGDDVGKYVCFLDGPNPVMPFLERFHEQLPLGPEAHCVTFIQNKERELFSIITLFGSHNPVMVRLGTFSSCVGVDAYICDWENKKDYTLTECVVKICGYEENDRWDTQQSSEG